jgi:hypothetical protein
MRQGAAWKNLPSLWNKFPAWIRRSRLGLQCPWNQRFKSAWWRRGWHGACK